MKNIKTASVIGLGYIGLPTAAMLASRGVKVIGVDVNQRAVEIINQGKIHIVEPGLDIIVQGVVNAGQLRAVTRPEAADVFVIAVPTPFKGDYEPDLSYVEAATRSIAPVLKKGNLIILESTSPVGTTELICKWLKEDRPDLTVPENDGAEADVFVAYCPERVLPGRVIHELTSNDRVVGGLTADSAKKASEFYKIFVEGQCLITNARTAEMVKLTENAFRDVNIAFANELSLICDKQKINVWELIKLANHHPRVSILQPGPGVGGHCISVDPWFIVHQNPEEARLMRTARQVNDYKPRYVLEQVKKEAARFKSPKIACLGLAFKADIDDLRESPSIEIVEHIASENIGQVLAVEPYIRELPKSLSKHANIKLTELNEALRMADIIVVLTNHKPFFEIPKEALRSKTVIDTRGIFQ